MNHPSAPNIEITLFSAADPKYRPLVRAARRLLSGVPASYLAGLRQIVLHEAAALTGSRKRRKARSRGRTYLKRQALGSYHRAWRGKSAWIELHADNMIGAMPAWLLRWPLIADWITARTLYHELGHHLHRTSAPEHKEPEIVAEVWRKKLSRAYFRKRYWYLVPVVWLLRRVVALVERSQR